MTQPLLTMRGIDKRFAGVAALTAASLEVGRGEVHALIGAAEPRLVAAMQATMMAVAPPPATPDVPAA